jgi:hypothetical protein
MYILVWRDVGAEFVRPPSRRWDDRLGPVGSAASFERGWGAMWASMIP